MEEAVTALLDNDTIEGIDILSKEYNMDRTMVINDLIREGLRSKIKKRALELYTSRKITLQKAAEMIGVSIWEMLEIIKKEEIHIDYGIEELKEDTEPLIKQ